MGILDGIFNESSTLTISTVKPEVKPVQFYWHIDVEAFSIIAIAPYPPSKEGIIGIPLDEQRAHNLINGIENINEWTVVYDTDKIVLRHDSEIEKEKLERLKSLPIFEVTDSSDNCDITVVVGDELYPECIQVYYNGDTIYNWHKPVKIYVTRENDPLYLKCSFTLSADVLDKILEKNNLSEWPNPILLKVHEADDISIYSARSNNTIAVKRI